MEMGLGPSRLHDRGRREQIAQAHRLIGPTIMGRLSHVQYVSGVDPVFAGLHGYEDIGDGRSYRTTAACYYPCHLSGPRDRRVTTIILPVAEPGWTGVRTVVHELGHALDEVTRFEHDAAAVTRYAETNRREAFAEAFTAWVWEGDHRPALDTLALFRSLVWP